MQANVDSFNSVSRFNSLSFRLLLGMLLWLMCALVFTGYTLLLSWELENGGVAINEAGSLRKRTFQMALAYNYKTDSTELRQQQVDFEQVLYNLKKVGGNKLLLSRDTDLTEQMLKVEQTWRQKIKPWYANLSSNQESITTGNREIIDSYANDINHLVKLIEEDNTKNIQLLRLFQALLIFMTFVTAVTGIFFTYRLVIRPLDILRGGIVRLALGDLNTRVQKNSNDEFGLVSDGFNQMAQNLKDLHHDLEQKIANKTYALAGKNHELSNLYTVTAFLHKARNIEDMKHGFISKMVAMMHAESASVHLTDESHQPLVDSRNHDLSIKQHQLNTPSFTHSYPIRFANQDLGLFTLSFSDKRAIDAESVRLIESLCAQLGVAIENQRLIERNQQFAISEERNLMAQGLHDSIAQTLSYLNLQVQMLESAIHDQETKSVDEYVKSIKHGISESYEDVRELLLNFRTKLSEKDFNSAVHMVLQRFEAQSQVESRLSIVGDAAPLSPRQQLQIIFILQEALSNVRKHAQATFVSVEIENQMDFIMRIVDNGIGFDDQTISQKKSNHVGTSIMQERASQIHAQVSITSQLGRGTQVQLILASTQRVVL